MLSTYLNQLYHILIAYFIKLSRSEKMQRSGERIFVFLIGCFLYSLIEITARGYTHWSMTITGGICMVFIYHMTNDTNINIIFKCIFGALFITCAEFVVGILVNIIFKWNVWDYSDMPANVLGKICLPFSFIWFMLCFVGYMLSKLISNKFRRIYEKEKISCEITQPIFLPQENL